MVSTAIPAEVIVNQGGVPSIEVRRFWILIWNYVSIICKEIMQIWSCTNTVADHLCLMVSIISFSEITHLPIRFKGFSWLQHLPSLKPHIQDMFQTSLNFLWPHPTNNFIIETAVIQVKGRTIHNIWYHKCSIQQLGCLFEIYRLKGALNQKLFVYHLFPVSNCLYINLTFFSCSKLRITLDSTFKKHTVLQSFSVKKCCNGDTFIMRS